MDSHSDTGRTIPGTRHDPEIQTQPTMSRLDQWLTTLVGRAGSDLLLIPGAPASIRFEGEVRPIDSETLDGPEIEAAVGPALTPHGLPQYRQIQIAHSSSRVSRLGPSPINPHRERGPTASSIRALHSKR